MLVMFQVRHSNMKLLQVQKTIKDYGYRISVCKKRVELRRWEHPLIYSPFCNSIHGKNDGHSIGPLSPPDWKDC